MQLFPVYDFKGNLLQKSRYVIKDSVTLASDAFIVDWSITEDAKAILLERKAWS